VNHRYGGIVTAAEELLAEVKRVVITSNHIPELHRLLEVLDTTEALYEMIREFERQEGVKTDE
jgi:hypothetical protein